MTTDTIKLKPLESYYFWNWILIGLSVKTPNIKKDASEITKIMSIRPGSYLGILKKNIFRTFSIMGYFIFCVSECQHIALSHNSFKSFFLAKLSNKQQVFFLFSFSPEVHLHIFSKGLFVFRGLLIFFIFFFAIERALFQKWSLKDITEQKKKRKFTLHIVTYQ